MNYCNVDSKFMVVVVSILLSIGVLSFFVWAIDPEATAPSVVNKARPVVSTHTDEVMKLLEELE